MEKGNKRKARKKTLGKVKLEGQKGNGNTLNKNVLRKVQTSKLIRFDEMFQNDKRSILKKSETSSSSYKTTKYDTFNPKNILKKKKIESRYNITKEESLQIGTENAENDKEVVEKKRKLNIEKIALEHISPSKKEETAYHATRTNKYTTINTTTNAAKNVSGFTSTKQWTRDADTQSDFATLRTYATIRTPLPRIKKKLSTSLATYKKTFKLNKKPVNPLRLENSACYSTGDMSIVKKNASRESLLKKSVIKKKKFTRTDEKKGTMVPKKKDVHKIRGKLRAATVAAKMKGKTTKLKKGRTLDFNVDTVKHSALIGPNRHVQIADDIQVVEVSTANKHAVNNGGKRHTSDGMTHSPSDKHRKEKCEEEFKKEETDRKEDKHEKSVKLGCINDESKERDLINKENKKSVYSLNGMEDEGYTNENEQDLMERNNGSGEYVKENRAMAITTKAIRKEAEENESSSDYNPEDYVEKENELEKQVETDPLKAQVDNILKKYIKYKELVQVNRKMKQTVNTEPIDIKDKSLKLDTINFLSHIKENTDHDDILFLFDNYEQKKKKNEDILRLFGKLFKYEYFELDRIQSVLILLDRIQQKMKKVMKTFPLKNSFNEVVLETKKLCEEAELEKQQMEHTKLLDDISTSQKTTEISQIPMDTNGNTVTFSTNMSIIDEGNKLVEIKIKKYNNTNSKRLDYMYAYGTKHIHFVPYLLRRHWHNEHKLENLRNILDEMKRRKKKNCLHTSKAAKPNTNCCLFNLLCTCFSCVPNQEKTMNFCRSLPFSKKTYEEYSNNSYNLDDFVDDTSISNSYKISDVVQAMLPN